MLPPILRDFPDSFETERLLIRSPRAGDGAALNAAIIESLDCLKPWMPFAQQTPTLEESEENCRQAYAKFLARTDLPLMLTLKDSGDFVGRCGIHPRNWEVPRFEIGYWCRTCFQGRGYITEAVLGMTRFAFEELGAQKIEIRCDVRNERSRRVAERAGYRLEGELRNDDLGMDGSLRDTLIFGLISEDFVPSHSPLALLF